ncbi:MAG TPA: DNA repair protein RecO [Rubrobacteraceae bacterium]|nr:DNA repair protein RecO [Rubrobacteraceae bacterium]
MALYKSKGIVLRSIRYGEADRILDLYTRDAGLVSAIAKGIRRTKSRFGARLEPLSCVDFVAYHGRTLDTVTQAEVLRSFRGVRENLDRLEAAAGMVGSVRALSGGDEADRRVFNLLYHGLDALENHDSGHGAVEAAFGLKLSILAGYAPQLDACLVCATDLDESAEPLYFAPDLGGLLCPECRATSITSDAFPLPPGTLDRLRLLVENPIREVPVHNGLGESELRVVRSHILAHAPGTALAASRLTGVRRPV